MSSGNAQPAPVVAEAAASSGNKPIKLPINSSQLMNSYKQQQHQQPPSSRSVKVPIKLTASNAQDLGLPKNVPSSSYRRLTQVEIRPAVVAQGNSHCEKMRMKVTGEDVNRSAAKQKDPLMPAGPPSIAPTVGTGSRALRAESNVSVKSPSFIVAGMCMPQTTVPNAVSYHAVQQAMPKLSKANTVMMNTIQRMAGTYCDLGHITVTRTAPPQVAPVTQQILSGENNVTMETPPTSDAMIDTGGRVELQPRQTDLKADTVGSSKVSLDRNKVIAHTDPGGVKISLKSVKISATNSTADDSVTQKQLVSEPDAEAAAYGDTPAEEDNGTVLLAEQVTKMPREMKLLKDTQSKSKVLAEFIDEASRWGKLRKRRESSASPAALNGSQQTPSPTTRTHGFRKRQKSRYASTHTEEEGQTVKRAGMRSENVEFQLKQKKRRMSNLRNMTDANSMLYDSDEDEPSSAEHQEINLSTESLGMDVPQVPVKLADPPKPGHDRFCWRCKQSDEGMIGCNTCPRTFHKTCTRPVYSDASWTCQDCRTTEAAHDINPFPIDGEVNLHRCLEYVLDQIVHYPRSMSHLFNPVDKAAFRCYDELVTYHMDLVEIYKKIQNTQYRTTEDFLSDLSWIVHNMTLVAAGPKMPNAAKSLYRTGKQQIAELETCRECFMHAYTKPNTWFKEACSKPHLLVWAKLKGYPYWPGKLMTVNGNNQADVRFFGGHDRAWVSVKDCYLFCERDPNPKSSKKPNWSESLVEAEDHIANLRQRFGSFMYAPPLTALNAERADEHLHAMVPGAFTLTIKIPKIAEVSTNPLPALSVEPKPTGGVDSVSFTKRPTRRISRAAVLSSNDISKEHADNADKTLSSCSSSSNVDVSDAAEVRTAPKKIEVAKKRKSLCVERSKHQEAEASGGKIQPLLIRRNSGYWASEPVYKRRKSVQLHQDVRSTPRSNSSDEDDTEVENNESMVSTEGTANDLSTGGDVTMEEDAGSLSSECLVEKVVLKVSTTVVEEPNLSPPSNETVEGTVDDANNSPEEEKDQIKVDEKAPKVPKEMPASATAASKPSADSSSALVVKRSTSSVGSVVVNATDESSSLSCDKVELNSPAAAMSSASAKSSHSLPDVPSSFVRIKLKSSDSCSGRDSVTTGVSSSDVVPPASLAQRAPGKASAKKEQQQQVPAADATLLQANKGASKTPPTAAIPSANDNHRQQQQKQQQQQAVSSISSSAKCATDASSAAQKVVCPFPLPIKEEITTSSDGEYSKAANPLPSMLLSEIGFSAMLKVSADAPASTNAGAVSMRTTTVEKSLSDSNIHVRETNSNDATDETAMLRNAVVAKPQSSGNNQRARKSFAGNAGGAGKSGAGAAPAAAGAGGAAGGGSMAKAKVNTMTIIPSCIPRKSNSPLFVNDGAQEPSSPSACSGVSSPYSTVPKPAGAGTEPESGNGSGGATAAHANKAAASPAFSTSSESLSVSSESTPVRSKRAPPERPNGTGLPDDLDVIVIDDKAPDPTPARAVVASYPVPKTRSLPQLQPKPIARLVTSAATDVDAPSAPASALDMLNESANRMSDYFRFMIGDIIRNFVQDGATDAEVLSLRLQLEQEQRQVQMLKKALADQWQQLTHDMQTAVMRAKRSVWCCVCSEEANFYCCWNTSYCSQDCQSIHWPDHEHSCQQPKLLTMATTHSRNTTTVRAAASPTVVQSNPPELYRGSRGGSGQQFAGHPTSSAATAVPASENARSRQKSSVRLNSSFPVNVDHHHHQHASSAAAAAPAAKASFSAKSSAVVALPQMPYGTLGGGGAGSGGSTVTYKTPRIQSVFSKVQSPISLPFFPVNNHPHRKATSTSNNNGNVVVRPQHHQQQQQQQQRVSMATSGAVQDNTMTMGENGVGERRTLGGGSLSGPSNTNSTIAGRTLPPAPPPTMTMVGMIQPASSFIATTSNGSSVGSVWNQVVAQSSAAGIASGMMQQTTPTDSMVTVPGGGQRAPSAANGRGGCAATASNYLRGMLPNAVGGMSGFCAAGRDERRAPPPDAT